MIGTKNAQDVEPASDGLLDKWALARKLDVGKRTVDAWMKQKRLPFIKLGKSVRFYWPDVLERLRKHQVN